MNHTNLRLTLVTFGVSITRTENIAEVFVDLFTSIADEVGTSAEATLCIRDMCDIMEELT